MLILNEEKYAKDIYDGNNKDIKSIFKKIGYVTRYLLYSLNKNDEDNYKDTVSWMKKYHNNFDESYYYNLISDAIKIAHKRPFYFIDSIKITKSELDIISSLNNLRAEKVLFVLLCMAKHQSVSMGFTNGLVKYSITDLCKMARISVPSDDREYILYNIVKHGFLECPKKNNTQCLIVNFIDNDGEIELNLNETDCQELAYSYLNWKNNGKGYNRCECCGKLIKYTKNNHRRFCEECSSIIGEVADDMKIITCIDCGEKIQVSVLNTKTCRCDKCQDEANKKSKRDWWNRNKNIE